MLYYITNLSTFEIYHESPLSNLLLIKKKTVDNVICNQYEDKDFRRKQNILPLKLIYLVILLKS